MMVPREPHFLRARRKSVPPSNKPFDISGCSPRSHEFPKPGMTDPEGRELIPPRIVDPLRHKPVWAAYKFRRGSQRSECRQFGVLRSRDGEGDGRCPQSNRPADERDCFFKVYRLAAQPPEPESGASSGGYGSSRHHPLPPNSSESVVKLLIGHDGQQTAKGPQQMSFVQRDHMVQDLSATTADPSFRDSVLPGRLNARPLRFQTRRLQKCDDRGIEFRIAIQNRVTVRASFRKSLTQLLNDPLRTRMSSDVEM